MITSGKYYVMYNDVSYIEEHNIKTKKVVRLETNWSDTEFIDFSIGWVELLSMTIDENLVYVLFSIKTGKNVGSYVSTFNHTFKHVETIKVLNVKPLTIASNTSGLYMSYIQNGETYIAPVSQSFVPSNPIKHDVTHLFGFEGNIYGFSKGTISGTYYHINFPKHLVTKWHNRTQKNGPDYGAHRDKFYGYSSPGYLSYNIITGIPTELNFSPKLNSYVLSTLNTSNGLSTISEQIVFGENMFMTLVGSITYPATEIGTLQEESGFVSYENFAPNIDLYTGR